MSRTCDRNRSTFLMTQNTLLEVEHISKNFGVVQALKDVSFPIYEGEILALVGENGAGKSTLAKIIAGVHTQSEGRIVFDGEALACKTTREARAKGIAIVLQEFALIPHLSIAENIFLTSKEMYQQGVWQNHQKMVEETEALFKRTMIDFDLDPNEKVQNLSVAQQQYVEIVKALSTNARLIILDEPTSALSQKEVQHLFALMQNLNANGVTLIFVSHKLDEIFTISDRIVVFRDGVFVKEMETSASNEQELIKAMVGRDVGDLYSIRHRAPQDERLLEVAALRNGFSPETPYNLHLDRGEVLGLFGLVGSGRTELMRSIFGADPIMDGSVVIKGKQTAGKPLKMAIQSGFGMLPEDRKNQGLLLEQSIHDNIFLAYTANRAHFFRNLKEEKRQAEQKIKELRIKMGSVNNPVNSLSGGNQQKVAFAKWLLVQPDVLILDEPTRGIDIGAKFEVYALIDQLANQGTSLLLVSSELPEILALSDRILVMNQGQVVKELDHSEASEELIMYYCTMDLDTIGTIGGTHGNN
ncbi:MAG: sugar ABC transporter ATP-binding protein [Spirochaetae bacterium HGW-Spirochaetae-4]|nr:MAG: sugar ABC transporter ATP-binding protein [Spirochaetae bacterium HGW-Spirochaetae-4]HCG62928.1 sugar ABC transporter ATP-binding protein [Sphaerochaeta sp.]